LKNKAKRNSKASVAIIRSKTTEKLYLAMLIDEHPYKVWNMSDLSPAALDFINELMRAYDLGYTLETQLPTVVEGVRQIIPYIYSLDDDSPAEGAENPSKNAIKKLIEKISPSPEISSTYNAECDNAVIRDKCDINNDTVKEMEQKFEPQENEVQFAPKMTNTPSDMAVIEESVENDVCDREQALTWISTVLTEEESVGNDVNKENATGTATDETSNVPVLNDSTKEPHLTISAEEPESTIESDTADESVVLETSEDLPVLPRLETIDIPDVRDSNGVYSVHYDGDTYSIEYKDEEENIVSFDAGIVDKGPESIGIDEAKSAVAEIASEEKNEFPESVSDIHTNKKVPLDNADNETADSEANSEANSEDNNHTMLEPIVSCEEPTVLIGKMCPNGHGVFEKGDFCFVCGSKLIEQSINNSHIDVSPEKVSLNETEASDISPNHKTTGSSVANKGSEEAPAEKSEEAKQVEPSDCIDSVTENYNEEEPADSEEDAFFSDFLASYKQKK